MSHVDHTRILACNRTLNLRSIRAIGYDMDYTLIDYDVVEWEERAYEHVRKMLVGQGFPLDGLSFSSTAVIRGLVIDTLTGNVVKANRFGFIKKAVHGSRTLSYDEMRKEYASTQVSLSNPRWQFLNTLFSISEGCLYRQMVDLLDAGKLDRVMGFADLYRAVREATDAAHMLGELKRDIVKDPSRYVRHDPDVVLTLLDQKRAGKKLLLITNSEWSYSKSMMEHAFDPALPKGMTWRDLFDVVIVSARKPEFFTSKSPLYEVASDEGLLRPIDKLRDGVVFSGGSSVALEQYLGVSGDEILYVGDHMFGDVHVTKDLLRWRTALILRELEDEVRDGAAFADVDAELGRLMAEKTELETRQCTLRVELLRNEHQYGAPSNRAVDDIRAELGSLKELLTNLDSRIAPLAAASAHLGNTEWGLLLRAGNDKSLLARQVERYADVYTSRVSNFLAATPYVFLRSPRGSLPHDLVAQPHRSDDG